MIKINIDTRKAKPENEELITTGSVGMRILFKFSQDWEGLAKTAVFLGRETAYVALEEGLEVECTIPWETLDKNTYDYRVGVYGTNGENIVIPTVYCNIGPVYKGTSISGEAAKDFTPTLADQVSKKASEAAQATLEAAEKAEKSSEAAVEAQNIAESIRKDADEGKFNGRDGVDGLPGRDGRDGVDGLPGRDGRDGVDGHTPVRGVDYWNDADQAAIDTNITGKVEEATASLKQDIQNMVGENPANDETGEELLKMLVEGNEGFSSLVDLCLKLPQESLGNIIIDKINEGTAIVKDILTELEGGIRYDN